MNVISKTSDIAPSTSIEPLLERVGVQIEQGLVPVEIFNQPAIFKAEMERIFARGWVFLGFDSEIPNPSDYMLRRIGTDSVIVTRDGKGAINVLANFCRHRGTRLCHADHGNASHFRCPYHGWVFKNNGDWVGAPDKSKAYRNIEEKDWGLLKAPHVETYVDGGENPRIDGAVVSLAASSGLFETMMARV
jgi:phenylpropionate dioxygenase-like ring-hydroxylating dioxygenase large terminal subunit